MKDNQLVRVITALQAFQFGNPLSDDNIKDALNWIEQTLNVTNEFRDWELFNKELRRYQGELGSIQEWRKTQ